MIEVLFFRLIIHSVLFSMSLHLCQSWNTWVINKRWDEYWNMPRRTIPLKHDICGKIISLKCWVHTQKFWVMDLGTELVNIELASSEIGSWKREGTMNLCENRCRNFLGRGWGYQGEKERPFLSLWGIIKLPKAGNRNLHFWRRNSKKSAPPYRDGLPVFLILVFTSWHSSCNRLWLHKLLPPGRAIWD